MSLGMPPVNHLNNVSQTLRVKYMGKNCKLTVVAVTWTLLWVRRQANEADLSIQKEIACVRKKLP